MNYPIPGGIAYLATPYSKYKPGIEQAFIQIASIETKESAPA